MDQFNELPDPKRTEFLIQGMLVKDVRLLGIDVVNASVRVLLGKARPVILAREINEWVATAEATQDLGKRLHSVIRARKRMHGKGA